MLIKARVLTDGVAEGVACRLTQPLSFWGGTDETGRIIDAHHPQCGTELAGRVLVMESGRGSSSSSSVLAEQIRTGHAPVAIIMAEPDTIVALGAIVAAELYLTAVPVVVISHREYEDVPEGSRLRVVANAAGGTISW